MRSRRSSPGSATASARSNAPDGESRRREAAAISAELAAIDRRLDESEPLANPSADAPTRPMVNPRRNVERFAPVKARMTRFTILATNNGIEPCIDELEVYTAAGDEESARAGAFTPPSPPARAGAFTPPSPPFVRGGREVAAPLNPPLTKGGLGGVLSRRDDADVKRSDPRNVALASAGGIASASSEYPDNPIHKIVHLNDGRHGNGRSWISRSPGRGVVTITWPEPATIDRVVWGRDREGVYRDRLATHYYIEVATEPDCWQVVASSVDRIAHRDTAADMAESPGADRQSPERTACSPGGPRCVSGSPAWARR